MTYDPNTVLSRYQQMLDVPEGEPTENFCALMRKDDPEGCVPHETLGCEPGGCQSCCVGVVEVVRQYSERQAALETRSIEFDDIQTKAEKLVREQ
jgi:hypothetical protein